MLRLLFEETTARRGVFASEPKSVVQPESIPFPVDALMLVTSDDFYLRKELERERGDMNLESAKEMLRSILDEERSETLDPSDMILPLEWFMKHRVGTVSGKWRIARL